MPRAICTGCGALFLGWALRYEIYQKCLTCGAPLEIISGLDTRSSADVSDRSHVSHRPAIDLYQSQEEANDRQKVDA
jgi:hypothetical protein